MPEAVYMDSHGYNPIWFLEHRWGVQFVHRKLAIILVLFTFYLWNKTKVSNIKMEQKKSLNLIAILVLIQSALGVLTLLYAAPLLLASLHQITAFALLMSVTYSLFVFKKV